MFRAGLEIWTGLILKFNWPEVILHGSCTGQEEPLNWENLIKRVHMLLA